MNLVEQKGDPYMVNNIFCSLTKKLASSVSSYGSPQMQVHLIGTSQLRATLEQFV